MLRLWRDRLHIGLAPDHVTWVQLAGTGTPRVRKKGVIYCTAPAESRRWAPALECVAALLREVETRRTLATVVLSDEFVRYALMPWNEHLNSAEEELAYARHCFESVHGKTADAWELRLSPGRSRESRVASAIDRALLDGLRQHFAASRLRISSIQPLLMAAFNRGRRYLNGAPSLFITAERQHYTCASYIQATCRSVRSGRFSGYREELAAILEREWLWLGTVDRPNVTLFLAGDYELGVFDDGRWAINALKMKAPPGLSAADVRSYALALSAG